MEVGSQISSSGELIQEPNWFGHSGDLGDIVFSLPTIRQAGGGILYLYHHPGRTLHGMSESQTINIRNLLLLQPYIRDVIWSANENRDHKLNHFRRYYAPRRNLADMHLASHGFSWHAREERWLTVDAKISISPVVFSKTVRYCNPKFPWKQIVSKYKSAIFLGTKEEHEIFCELYGKVAYYETPTLLDAARVIAGSKLVITNQNALHAIAEGLKHNLLLEVYPRMPFACFYRPGVVHGWDECIELPDLVTLR